MSQGAKFWVYHKSPTCSRFFIPHSVTDLVVALTTWSYSTHISAYNLLEVSKGVSSSANILCSAAGHTCFVQEASQQSILCKCPAKLKKCVSLMLTHCTGEIKSHKSTKLFHTNKSHFFLQTKNSKYVFIIYLRHSFIRLNFIDFLSCPNI